MIVAEAVAVAGDDLMDGRFHLGLLLAIDNNVLWTTGAEKDVCRGGACVASLRSGCSLQ